MPDAKPIAFLGSSLDDLRSFPLEARRDAGHQLDQVQHGREPDDWKPMGSVGQEVFGRFAFAMRAGGFE